MRGSRRMSPAGPEYELAKQGAKGLSAFMAIALTRQMHHAKPLQNSKTCHSPAPTMTCLTVSQNSCTALSDTS